MIRKQTMLILVVIFAVAFLAWNINNVDDVKILASVNGVNVLSSDVNDIKQLVSNKGQDISDEDALEQAIDQSVLYQNALGSGFEITNEDAEGIIVEQLSAKGNTLEDFKDQLKSSGLSYDDQLVQARKQIAIQNYINNAFEGEKFEASPDEIDDFYNEYKGKFPEIVQPSEEIEPQIIQALELQKKQNAIRDFVQELRNNSEIIYFNL